MRRPTSPRKGPSGSQLDEDDARRTSAHYERIASEYDQQVDSLERNRAAREAFRAHVSALAGPGGTILDFGSGTGIDAAWYAERGHRVVAYDPSPGMMAVLRARTAEAIARGEIVAVEGPLDALWAALGEPESLDAIAANFAVLNHVRQLRPLLQRLATYLRGGGTLTASLLNALQRGAMRTRGWQREALRSLATGSIVNRGQVTSYRHHLWAVRRAGRPHLVLREVAHADSDGRWRRGRPRGHRLLRQEFVFVVMRKWA